MSVILQFGDLNAVSPGNLDKGKNWKLWRTFDWDPVRGSSVTVQHSGPLDAASRPGWQQEPAVLGIPHDVAVCFFHPCVFFTWHVLDAEKWISMQSQTSLNFLTEVQYKSQLLTMTKILEVNSNIGPKVFIQARQGKKSLSLPIY